MIRKKKHNYKLQTNSWHREEEQHNNHETPGNKQSKATSSLFPNQDDYKTRMDK